MADNRAKDLSSLKVAVIGSGLSAVGAIKALKKIGIKPTVLDWGDKLDVDRSKQIDNMANSSPDKWNPAERVWLNKHNNFKNNNAIPKKLAFGSDYFYGNSRKEAPVEAVGNLPAFSYALGGLSCGWGAAVLPPQACDISDWPVELDELHSYCKTVLTGLPYSATEDGLSLNFPTLSAPTKPLRLSRASSQLLDSLNKTSILKKDEIVFGQSRLLISPETSSEWMGCQYCGQCMSGCVYGSIYKAGDDILDFQKKGEINYISGCLVDRLTEAGEKVTISYSDREGKSHSEIFDRVFLSAGAVNSTRIVMTSLNYGGKAALKSRGGFVIPAFSFRNLPTDWPHCNTEPGIFLDFKGKGLEHWVHVQISTDNELLLQKLGTQTRHKGFIGRLKKFISNHVVLLLVNYHSDHAGTYELQISPSAGLLKKSSLHTVHQKSFPQWGVLWRTSIQLLKVFSKIGCLPLLPFAKLNSGSYHVGGTLPMKSNPTDMLDTDILGRVDPWRRIHIVDTSVFPSLPGTTIGLLAMANAYRIVDKIEWFNQSNGSV